MSESSQPNTENKKKERSPAYPAISLRAAMDLARKFWDTDKRQTVFFTRAAINLGFTPKSSGGMLALAAMKKFGLIDDEGINEGRKVRLTDRAISILNPNNPERGKLLKEAALRPPILTELWNRFGADGNDGTMRDFLLFERKFYEPAANTLISVFKDTITFAQMANSDKESESELPFEADFTIDTSMPVTMPEATAPSQLPKPTQTLGHYFPHVSLRDVVAHPTNVTKVFTLPLDDENEVEIRFLGSKFDASLLSELEAGIKFLKSRFKIAAPTAAPAPEPEASDNPDDY